MLQFFPGTPVAKPSSAMLEVIDENDEPVEAEAIPVEATTTATAAVAAPVIPEPAPESESVTVDVPVVAASVAAVSLAEVGCTTVNNNCIFFCS